jgi:hypothetical protein
VFGGSRKTRTRLLQSSRFHFLCRFILGSEEPDERPHEPPCCGSSATEHRSEPWLDALVTDSATDELTPSFRAQGFGDMLSLYVSNLQ